jgi:hypothetical protein
MKCSKERTEGELFFSELAAEWLGGGRCLPAAGRGKRALR